jgi:hypothetical protein
MNKIIGDTVKVVKKKLFSKGKEYINGTIIDIKCREYQDLFGEEISDCETYIQLENDKLIMISDEVQLFKKYEIIE